MAILPSENPRIVNTSLERSQYSSGIDFSLDLVRYFTILGFSDGRIVAVSPYINVVLLSKNHKWHHSCVISMVPLPARQ
jgi:hypothetical protein